MHCLNCQCPNESCFKEVWKNGEYSGFICAKCALLNDYCSLCDLFHKMTDYLGPGKCIYQMPGYISLKKKLDDLLAYLVNNSLIPNYLV